MLTKVCMFCFKDIMVCMFCFKDIMVNQDFLDVFNKVKEVFPDVKMRHGGDAAPKRPKARVHPMVKLKNYIDKHNLRLVDFFNKFDKDQSMSVTREEFTQGIEVIRAVGEWNKHVIWVNVCLSFVMSFVLVCLV